MPKWGYLLVIICLVGSALFFQNCSKINVIPMAQMLSDPNTDTNDDDGGGGGETSGNDDDGQYNTQTEDTNCGGSYEFEKNEEFNSDGSLRRVVFRLRDRIANTYVLPTWYSTQQGTPITNPPEYSFSNIRGCDLIFIEARFQNRCGDNAALGYIYTHPSCPPPNPNTNVSCDQITRPENHQRLLQAYKRRHNSDAYSLGPVSTLVEATYYDTATNPQPVLDDWYGNSSNWIKIPNQNYLSMSFTAPAGIGYFDTWVSGSGGCAVTMAISKCEGDFYLGRDPKNCLSPTHGEISLGAYVDPDPSDPQQSRLCKLESGQKYYLNIIGYDFINGQPVNESECIWFGGLNDQ